MNEQPPMMSDEDKKKLVKGREHEFTYLVIPCVETFRRGLDWSARLVLAHRVDGNFVLACGLAETNFESIPEQIQKWEKILKVH